MATNIALITDALRLLGVIAEAESPSAEQGSHALGRLNRMLEQWTEDEIDLGWYEQTDTTADAPIPKWAERGVISKLAQDLRATYPSASLEASVLDDNLNGFGTIQRQSVLSNREPADLSHMPAGSGRYGAGYNISDDTV
jgi:hypothetical protein